MFAGRGSGARWTAADHRAFRHRIAGRIFAPRQNGAVPGALRGPNRGRLRDVAPLLPKEAAPPPGPRANATAVAGDNVEPPGKVDCGPCGARSRDASGPARSEEHTS